MNKKWIYGLVFLLAIIVLGVIYCLGGKREYDKEKNCVIITGDKWNDYTYAVYKDYIELLDYTGDELEVIVPEKIKGKPVTVIGEECFKEKAVVSIILGKNVEQIKYGSFRDSENLTKVTGDIELERIANSAFAGCTNLKQVQLGNNITVIEGLAFAYCPQLESIGQQPKISSIEDFAFYRAGSLSDFEVPVVTEVGARAFSESKWLENKDDEFVIVGTGVLLAYKGNSEIVRVPESVVKIDQPFEYCLQRDNIKEVYFPDTVTELYWGALQFMEDITVYMPASIVTIGKTVSNPEDSISAYTETMTIVTTEGSYAEEYAKKYGIKCVIAETW